MISAAILWDNFGPMHDDRLRAVAEAFGSNARVSGIELFSKSDTYAWDNDHNTEFEKATLFPGADSWTKSSAMVALAIFRRCHAVRATHIFLCHYEKPAIFAAATLLRLSGKKVYVMSCSKFDDYERNINREFLKKLFFLPYHGAISSGKRARDFMRLMGIPRDRIATEYNTLSIARIRKFAAKQPAPKGVSFAQRHFTIVARFVEKKNLEMAIDAYASYCQRTDRPRQLHLCGSGRLEQTLRNRVQFLGLEGKVIFRGFLQSDGIASVLGDTLALLLPSIEEQFGNVVIEAQAMGLPVILSDNCGARDNLIRTGVNGFVVEPDNPKGLAFFMEVLDRDEQLWTEMCIAAGAAAQKGDVARFAEAIQQLIKAS